MQLASVRQRAVKHVLNHVKPGASTLVLVLCTKETLVRIESQLGLPVSLQVLPFAELWSLLQNEQTISNQTSSKHQMHQEKLKKVEHVRQNHLMLGVLGSERPKRTNLDQSADHKSVTRSSI